ncbi:LRP1B [Mytilus edulis]|uniref:LRP1B n=1 Tax=Mytilus edulis TaxID=6550 RepID=A0A8S3V4R0_MYTED|nr:LRP1B [Mytilus edulis]
MDFKRKSLVCVLALILNTNLVLAEDRKLLAASSKELVFMNIDGTNHEVIVQNDMYNIRSIAYHETRKYIYFTEYQSGNITRFHFPSDDYIMKVIVQQNSGHVVSGITVDYINDYLYWTNSNDSSDGKILRSNLDGSDITLILDFTSYGSLGVLEVDLINGWIYFINALNGSIYRCMVDGSDLQLYFSSWWIYDIAIDNQDQRIYFSTSHSVGSTTHDGSDLRTIPIEYRFWSGHNRIELSGDDIFYSDNYLMYRATKTILKQFGGDCEKYTAIKNEEKDQRTISLTWQIVRSTSDEYLDDKWYRIFSANGDQMPSHPPGIMHCGTIYPIWLNGIY